MCEYALLLCARKWHFLSRESRIVNAPETLQFAAISTLLAEEERNPVDPDHSLINLVGKFEENRHEDKEADG